MAIAWRHTFAWEVTVRRDSRSTWTGQARHLPPYDATPGAFVTPPRVSLDATTLVAEGGAEQKSRLGLRVRPPTRLQWVAGALAAMLEDEDTLSVSLDSAARFALHVSRAGEPILAIGAVLHGRGMPVLREPEEDDAEHLWRITPRGREPLRPGDEIEIDGRVLHLWSCGPAAIPRRAYWLSLARLGGGITRDAVALTARALER